MASTKEAHRRKAANGRQDPCAWPLLTRENFERLCFERSNLRCVLCGGQAVDAHHIFERKLFPDGGYRLNNAAALCSPCHWRAEIGLDTPCAILAACGLDDPLPPPHAAAAGLSPSAILSHMDKWGNLTRSDGSIAPGPLFQDDGCRKALAAGGRLGLCYEAGDFQCSQIDVPAATRKK